MPYFSPARPIEFLVLSLFSCSIYIVQCRGGDFVAQINFLCERLNFSCKFKIQESGRRRSYLMMKLESKLYSDLCMWDLGRGFWLLQLETRMTLAFRPSLFVSVYLFCDFISRQFQATLWNYLSTMEENAISHIKFPT